MSYRKSKGISNELKLEVAVAKKLCGIVGSPRALTVKLLLEHQEYHQLVDLECDPVNYQHPQHFAEDYLVTEVLQKSKNLPLGIDRRAAAIEDFFKAELQCKKTNDRLWSTPNSQFTRLAWWIQSTIGTLTKSQLREIERRFRHGTGSTTGIKADGEVPSLKYDAQLHLTENLYPFYKAIIGPRWHEHADRPVVVKGNKFTTVPKSAKKDRGIATEPTLNIYVQLGIGTYLKHLLRKQKIDLYSQRKNQYLASVAHSRNLATIDLSMASDTLSLAAVEKLLPPRWLELLTAARSPFTQIEKEIVPLEKFSSMGNGFTFELETLIFAAVVRTIVPPEELRNVSIYGDDIICPSRYALEVVDMLNFLGFSVNGRKSFLAGRFYESCGSDWFDGQPVRPFYLRKEKNSTCPYPLALANNIRQYAAMQSGNHFCDVKWKDVWDFVVRQIPHPWRKCHVPYLMGDVGLHVDSCEAKHIPETKGHEGKVVEFVHHAPVKRRTNKVGYLFTALARSANPFVSLAEVPKGYLDYEDATRNGRVTYSIENALCTYGREPVRGYLRKPRTKKRVSNLPFSPSWE